MGMCALGDTLKAKAENILGDIKGVKTYINDIFVLRKERFSKHVDQLRIVFGRLRPEGLKVDAPKFSFWIKDIPYLRYLITWEVIEYRIVMKKKSSE